MGKIVKSFAELEKACQAKMMKAMSDTVDKSFQDLHTNVDHFYDSPGNPTSVASPPPGYDRTGQLGESPEQELSGGGNTAHGKLRLDTSYRYHPSGRDTNTIYGWAENGGLLGNSGFWERTKNDVQKNIDDIFGREFTRK